MLQGYGDPIEQLLLELRAPAHAAFGLSMGAALPGRLPRIPPALDLRDQLADDAGTPVARIRRPVWHAVEGFRRAVDDRVDEADASVAAALEQASEAKSLDDRDRQRVRERIRALPTQAPQLDRLAVRREWMLPTDLAAPARQ